MIDLAIVSFALANSCLVPLIFSSSSGAGQPLFVTYLMWSAYAIGFLLIIRDFWPKKLVKFLPLYWYFSIFFCLPYLSISMCLFTSCALEWVIDVVLTIFILGILVDWKSHIIMTMLGAISAWFSWMLFGDGTLFSQNVINFPLMIYAAAVALLFGTVFSRNKERLLMEKLTTFKALGETIAHEMRTPLSSITISANGLIKCLPSLIYSYEQAQAFGIKVPKIPKLVLDSAANAPERMRYTCASTLNTIDMILLQLKDQDWRNHFNICSIKTCVEIALRDYSFRESEKELVDISDVADFKFFGHEHLVVHILYNLLRNAITFIHSEKKGTIKIWTQDSGSEFRLHFHDTAKGINSNDISRVFEHGFSKRSGGSGVGLFYCKRMMETMLGDITVRAVEKEYCEFILHFKKPLDDQNP